MGLSPNAGANPRPAAKSAIDPGILIPEISLLLEFVSGRPNTSLSGGSQALLPKGKDYDAALNEYFRIRGLFNQGGQPSDPDTKFLLEFRDYLNSRSYPAMGSTISFTTLVSGQGQKNKAAVLDAQQAYPEFQSPARTLSTWIAVLQGVAILATVIVAVLAAYVYWGNLIVSNIAELAERMDTIDKGISTQEAVHAVKFDDKSYIRLCDGILKELYPEGEKNIQQIKVDVFYTTEQYHICGRRKDVVRKMDKDYMDLVRWWNFGTWWHPPVEEVTDQSAAGVLSVMNGYLIPLLLGLLGSTAYVLRLYLTGLRDRVLNPYFLRSANVRIALGTLSGLAIGFFLSPGGAAAKSPAGLATVVTLSTPALAFLAGYAVEVLFKFIDVIAEQVFQSKPS